MKRVKRKKRKTARYAQYYEKIMDPIWAEQWEKSLRRVKKLKKEILALGPIPTKEVQLIKTINYFVKFINLLTDFLDKGQLKCAPVDKAQYVSDFNDMLITFVAREKCTICYLNKSEVGKTVTTNNLYLGVFVPITEKDDLNNIQTKNINGRNLKIDVDFTPISDWLNKRVMTLNGYQAKVSQKRLAKFLNEMQSIVLETIDKILEE